MAPDCQPIQGGAPVLHRCQKQLLALDAAHSRLPSETDMQQNTALAIAKEHLKLYGETDETLSQIDNVQYFFDVTEPERPQWRIIVEWNTDIAHHNVERERQYFIKINAVTGEVLDTIFSPQGIDNDDIRNKFIGEP